jgi:hypothetical protein
MPPGQGANLNPGAEKLKTGLWKYRVSYDQGYQMVYVFAYQKYQSGCIIEALGTDNVCTYIFDRLVQFIAFYKYILRLLVYFVVIWYIFQFWYAVPRKIWQPCNESSCSLL